MDIKSQYSRGEMPVEPGQALDERCHAWVVTPLPAADKGKDSLADGTFAGIRRLTRRR